MISSADTEGRPRRSASRRTRRKTFGKTRSKTCTQTDPLCSDTLFDDLDLLFSPTADPGTPFQPALRQTLWRDPMFLIKSIKAASILLMITAAGEKQQTMKVYTARMR